MGDECRSPLQFDTWLDAFQCTFMAQNKVIHSSNVFHCIRTLTLGLSTSWLPSCGAGVS